MNTTVQKEKTSIHGLVQMEQNFTVSISTLGINSLELKEGWRVLTQRLLPRLL
jgi:hypothetical protein